MQEIAKDEIIVGDRIRVEHRSLDGSFTSVREGDVFAFTPKNRRPKTKEGYLIDAPENVNDGIMSDFTLIKRRPFRYLNVRKTYQVESHDLPGVLYAVVSDGEFWTVAKMLHVGYQMALEMGGAQSEFTSRALAHCTYGTDSVFFMIQTMAFEKDFIKSIQMSQNGLTEAIHDPLAHMDRTKIYRIAELDEIIYFDKEWMFIQPRQYYSYPRTYRYDKTEWELMVELDVAHYLTENELIGRRFMNRSGIVISLDALGHGTAIKRTSSLNGFHSKKLDAEGFRAFVMEHIAGQVQEIP